MSESVVTSFLSVSLSAGFAGISGCWVEHAHFSRLCVLVAIKSRLLVLIIIIIFVAYHILEEESFFG
jgi:hypothetical protein